jgi:hypothetical protein
MFKIAIVENEKDTENKVSSEKLSLNKIESFKKVVGNEWRAFSDIRKIMESYKVGRQAVIDQPTVYVSQAISKAMFLDQNYISYSGIEVIGQNIATYENESYIRKFDTEPLIVKRFSFEALTEQISNLMGRGYTPSIILVSKRDLYSELYQESEVYKPNSAKDPTDPFKITGFLNNIPVVEVYSAFLEKRILVMDIKATAIFEYEESKDWYDNKLKIEISEFTMLEIVDIYEKAINEWNNKGYTKEDALIAIRNSVKLDILIKSNLKIINHESYLLVEVEE